MVAIPANSNIRTSSLCWPVSSDGSETGEQQYSYIIAVLACQGQVRFDTRLLQRSLDRHDTLERSVAWGDTLKRAGPRIMIPLWEFPWHAWDSPWDFPREELRIGKHRPS